MTGKSFHSQPVQLVLDIGASHHMTSNIHIIFDLYNLSTNLYVTLLDARTVSVRKAGTVKIGAYFTFKNVLYIPSLACNLISIGQLTTDMNCIVTYGANFCLISP